jgi:hypothetical protein
MELACCLLSLLMLLAILGVALSWAIADVVYYRKRSWEYLEKYDSAVAELNRLRRGDFTEEEFQNLCHNSSADDACRFRAGCEAYQRKLFGGQDTSPPDVQKE